MARRRKRLSKPSLSRRRLALRIVGLISLVMLLVSGLYVVYLDWQVTSKFEGKRWALPARVFARPLELYEGLELRPENLEAELRAVGYRIAPGGRAPGSYYRSGDRFFITTRAFQHPDATEPAHALEVSFDGHYVAALRSQSGAPVDLVRLEPALIGSIYPSHQEDRILVRLEEVPPLLVQALIAVEDREFYSHYGISFGGLARAMLANLRAGRVVQGGSTITQQLVKNFYLSNERTLLRKFNEAIMALLLEAHYDKDEILEAYLNEVFLGQDGRRAIHGFGLASQFYFNKPMDELKEHQLALLAGLVKGASYYDPRRHPERARERRDLVLRVLAEQQVLSAAAARTALGMKLDVSEKPRTGDARYPAFMDLVKLHLQRDYNPSDLNSEGLRIFTTLAPHVQSAAETALQARLKAWNKPELQGAVVVLSVDDAGVLALVGGREPRFAGFNRALDARRPVGSLIKPAVYLAALERPGEYGLGTLLEDEPLSVQSGGQLWQPKNYDGRPNGAVPLWRSLANSYNLSVVRLGMSVGMRHVTDVLRRLGVEPPERAYPSLFLGAVNYTPLEMARMYHTLATGGFRSEPRSVRAVMTASGELLSRYPLRVERAVEPGPAYLINHGMTRVMHSGTGRGVARWLGEAPAVAGKTGSTDDLRDSWFAGYSGDAVGVVWLGLDDNGRAGLTGSSGALTVWGELFARLDWRPLELTRPESVEELWIEPETGLLAAEYCAGAVAIPYMSGYAPAASSHCADTRNPFEKATDWFRGVIK